MTVRPSLTVVTPSFRQPAWLRLCAASVADQEGVRVEHLVQDALSGPEIAEALRPFPHVRLTSEKDDGMYDAIRRGWARSTGDLLCWLNCDEQYLPGALAAAVDFLAARPEVDVLFGDAIVVDGAGRYLCSRQVLTPHLYHTWTCQLHTLSCAMFFRRRLFDSGRFALDPRWKYGGDGALIVALLRAGVRMAHVPRYLAAFVDNGENGGLRPAAEAEREALRREAPRWVQAAAPIWKIAHRLRRGLHGHYAPRLLRYSIYTPAEPSQRTTFNVEHPTFYWASRMKGKR